MEINDGKKLKNQINSKLLQPECLYGRKIIFNIFFQPHSLFIFQLLRRKLATKWKLFFFFIEHKVFGLEATFSLTHSLEKAHSLVRNHSLVENQVKREQKISRWSHLWGCDLKNRNVTNHFVFPTTDNHDHDDDVCVNVCENFPSFNLPFQVWFWFVQFSPTPFPFPCWIISNSLSNQVPSP